MEWEYEIIAITIFIGIISSISCICYGVYKYHELEISNFQTTIKDLSDEQKCLHICGFEFSGSTLFDAYKFCVEKCDRISERMTACNQ